MVEISLSGSGEGPGRETGWGYSTALPSILRNPSFRSLPCGIVPDWYTGATKWRNPPPALRNLIRNKGFCPILFGTLVA